MEVTTQNPKLAKAISDRELIEALQSASKKEEFDSLFTQFFNRFKGYLFKAALQCTRNFTDAEALATEITQVTFTNLFIKRTFLTLPPDATDIECTNRIKGWLGQIANNNFNIEYAKQKNIDSIDDVLLQLEELRDESFNEYDDEIEVETTNEFMNTIQQALNSIKKEDHRHILREYAREGCIDSGKHLSKNTMDFLCKFYNTTPENIRQIKKRTLDKIKQHCFNNTK